MNGITITTWRRQTVVVRISLMKTTAVLLVLLAACGGTMDEATTTSTSSTTSTSTTTTTTIDLPDAPHANQLYTYTLVQFEALMRGLLGFECDDWTVIENGADRGSCVTAEEDEELQLFTFETFPGSVRLEADRVIYATEWREMYSNGSQCPAHRNDHAAVGHSWIVFAEDRTVVDRIVEGTGAVYLAPPDC